jgi:hypothetical protein
MVFSGSLDTKKEALVEFSFYTKKTLFCFGDVNRTEFGEKFLCGNECIIFNSVCFRLSFYTYNVGGELSSFAFHFLNS